MTIIMNKIKPFWATWPRGTSHRFTHRGSDGEFRFVSHCGLAVSNHGQALDPSAPKCQHCRRMAANDAG